MATFPFYVIPAIPQLDFLLPIEQMRRGLWRCEIASFLLEQKEAQLRSLTHFCLAPQPFYMCFIVLRNMCFTGLSCELS